MWTPGGRRVFAAAHSGEFALWAGAAGFAFESVLQASCEQLLVHCTMLRPLTIFISSDMSNKVMLKT